MVVPGRGHLKKRPETSNAKTNDLDIPEGLSMADAEALVGSALIAA